MSHPLSIGNSEIMGAITSDPQKERPIDLQSWPKRFARPRRAERGKRLVYPFPVGMVAAQSSVAFGWFLILRKPA
jgi:hypothetical protein